LWRPPRCSSPFQQRSWRNWRSVRRHSARATTRKAAPSTDAGVVAEAAEQASSAEAGKEEEAASEPERWAVAGWAVTGLAAVGALDCAYLTLVKLGQTKLVCPATAADSCSQVLNSSWASVGPVPLPALGFLAYAAVAALSVGPDWAERDLLWWLCLAMALVSAGLMGILIFLLKVPCVYCAASAFAAAGLLALVEIGRSRRVGRDARGDVSVAVGTTQPRRPVIALAVVDAVGAFAAATLGGKPASAGKESFYHLSQRYKPDHPPVRSSSSPAEQALAKHLTAVGAACYSAWWCPHCQEQRELFGKEAVALAPFVECSTVQRKETQVCKDKDISGYPTWIIRGKTYGGAQSLAELAEFSGFTELGKDAFPPRSEEASSYVWE